MMKAIKYNATLIQCIFVLGIFSFTAMPVWAEPVDCKNTEDGIEVDSGVRMKCKHSKLLEQQGLLINKLALHFEGAIPDDIARLKKAQERAVKAKDRTSAKDFKKIGKKSPAICEYAEYGDDASKDENDVCGPGERCLEFEGDGDGVCKLKGNKAEVCMCLDGSSGDESMVEDIDSEYLDELELTYDDVTLQLELANMKLDEQAPALAVMSTSLVNGAESSNPCEPKPDWHKYGEVMTMTILKQAEVGLRGIADIAERGCDQTGAGFNCSTCCVIAETLASVAALAVETMEGIFKLKDWYDQSTKHTCLMTLYDDVQTNMSSLGSIESSLGPPPKPPIPGGLNQGLADVIRDMGALQEKVRLLNEQITAFETLMNNRLDETRDILLTPHGQREKLFPPEEDGGK